MMLKVQRKKLGGVSCRVFGAIRVLILRMFDGQITTPEEDRRDIESLYHKMTVADLTHNLTKVQYEIQVFNEQSSNKKLSAIASRDVPDSLLTC